MGTVKVKMPMANTKTIYHKNTIYQYITMNNDDDKLMVQHNVNTEVYIPVDKKILLLLTELIYGVI